VKRFVRRILNATGVDVRLVSTLRKSAENTWEKKQDALWRPFLGHRDIQTVVDVGANEGQFAKLIHRQCREARIISFEPLESCQAELKSVLSGIPGSSIVKAAVGDQPGLARMNSSAFSPCSSLLSGTNLLGEDYAEAANVQSVEVPVVTIDDALSVENLRSEILVKFDVQGFELPAMRGAVKLLERASIVVCEVCFFRRLYDGQPLFHEIYAALRDYGFTYMGNAEQSSRRTDGRIVEADAIFERI